MTLENDRAPLLYYIKLCASFQIHRWNETEVKVQKRSIWVKIGNFLSRVTLKFDGCLWKTIGHLFKLQALCIISQPSVNSNWSYSPETPNLGQIQQFLKPCDLQIWQMTLQNNRAPLLCYFKLCASFHTHWWIQIWVTVWNRSIRVKIDDCLSRVTYKFHGWPSKTIGHLFYATSSFVYHFVPIGEFKLELQSGNAQFGSNSTIFRAVRPWNLTDDLEKQ